MTARPRTPPLVPPSSGRRRRFCSSCRWSGWPSASLRQPGAAPPRTIEWLPDPVAWANYARIFELAPLGTFIGNSLLVVALAVPVTVLTASWAGLAMAQLPEQARRRLVVATFLLLLVPVAALWLARYVLFSRLGLVDTVWALRGTRVDGHRARCSCFSTTGRSVGSRLSSFEAARLDGAGVLVLWARIAMPIARPTTLTVAVLAFILYWSDFIGPLLYLKSESRYTLPVGVRSLQQMDKSNWPLLMAAAATMSAPVIAMFILAQRHFWPESWRSEAIARSAPGPLLPYRRKRDAEVSGWVTGGGRLCHGRNEDAWSRGAGGACLVHDIRRPGREGRL